MKWYRLYKESNDSDFRIKNDILEEYTGKGGDVVIPDGVTSIGKDAFYSCKSLTSVTIPSSVTSIGGWAFYGCSGLTSVTIPDSVTRIEESAFSVCSGLTSVTIPNSVTGIGDDAFYYCYRLTSVTIPDSVTSIGKDAFHQCKNLKSITVKGKSSKEAKTLLEDAVDDLSIVNVNKTFAVWFKYSHRTDDEQEFSASSPEDARRKFEKWAADMENSEDFDFEFIDAKEA